MRLEATVSDYMVSPVHSVAPDASIEEVTTRLDDLGVSALPVIGHRGILVGVISRADLVRRSVPPGPGRRLRSRRAHVAELMHETVQVVDPSVTLERAARRMSTHHHHRLFVVAGDALVGVISTREMIRAAARSERAVPVRALMSTELVEIAAEDPVALAVNRMAAVGVRSVIVTRDRKPAGLFSQPEALRARDVDPATPVGRLARTDLLMLPSGTAASRAAELMDERSARTALVVDGERAVGIVTGTDFARLLGGLV